MLPTYVTTSSVHTTDVSIPACHRDLVRSAFTVTCMHMNYYINQQRLLQYCVLIAQKDSWAIDYQATLNTLEVAQEAGASHFVLLSAICVQKPLLEFQHAKLKFEHALQSAEGITYSIVRPTAFFKSLAGQASPLVHLSLQCTLSHSITHLLLALCL